VHNGSGHIYKIADSELPFGKNQLKDVQGNWKAGY